MDPTIKRQLEAIRRSGETNMLDIKRVQQIADREGFYGLVIFIEEHRSEYIKFIFHGDPDDEDGASEAGIPQIPADAENGGAAEDTEDDGDAVDLTGTVPETAYHYNLTGQKRKELVDAVSKILDTPAVYQKAPTFAYKIGEYTVDRNGSLTLSGNVSPTEAERLIRALREQGLVAEDTGDTPDIQDGAETVAIEGEPAQETETADRAATQDKGTLKTPVTPDTSTDTEDLEDPAVTKAAPDTDPDGDKPENLTIEIPRNTLSDPAYISLKKIIASKATLLRQALGTETLEIRETAERLCFPWFTLHGLEGEAEAYTRLITAMVEMAKRQKRVVATEKPLENAKFTMRVFLIRLGFIGDEHKTARKILLRNLTGNSSWKAGCRPADRADDRAVIPPDPEAASGHIPTDTEDTGVSEDALPDTLSEDKGECTL